MKSTLIFEKSLTKRLIGVLLEQSITIYRQRLKNERAQLHHIEFKENERTFSIIGHIELFADSVAGVASSITKKGTCQNCQEVIDLLKSMDIFLLTEFQSWFFSNRNTFPETCIYIELTDYLRRLCLEYLSEM